MKGKNFKAGVFALCTILLLIYMVLRVNRGSLFQAGTYPVYLEVQSALGLEKKTPVQIAGVYIGEVTDVILLDSQRAKVTLAIRNGVTLSRSAKANIKTIGILGDAYIEMYQPGPLGEPMAAGSTISDVTNFGDLNSVTQQVSGIAEDVKAITSQMRKLMASDDSPFDKTIKNLETITTTLSKMTTTNEKNLDAIMINMRALAQNLNTVVAQNMGRFDRSVYNIEQITQDVQDGKGTVGKLLKDEETVNKLNSALEGINDFLGSTNRTQVDVGIHAEYLAGTGNFKNYVSLYLKPRPDKYFLFEVVSDPDPSFNTTVDETIVTSGGASTTITTKTRHKALDGLMFSAQLVKKFHEFTIRGGLMESSGGVGVDYDRGPFGLTFTAFDFKSDEGQRPHLKAMARTQLTTSFYLLGGVDDIINNQQDLAWFFGAGLTFTDDDIKSLLGLMGSVGGASRK